MSFAPSPEQLEVIETWGQGMAVLAGAGSGKTTTLVRKCQKLLEINPDARFAAVSFTERSASDLRAKLAKADGGALAGDRGGALARHWVMTIHGLCGAILREYPREAGYDGEETMLSEPEAQLLWGRAVEQIWTDADRDQKELSAALELLLSRESRDGLGSLLARARNLETAGLLEALRSPAEDDPSTKALATVAAFVLDRYERLKRRRGALDFNDLEKGADLALEHASVRQAYQRRFDLVLIDEFQDTNAVQARIILRLVKPDLSNLCVVGDPKQSIYRFRDADVGVFNEFCSKLPVQVALTRNFRSRPAILELVNQVCERAFPSSGLRYQPLTPMREASPEIDPVVKLPVRNPRDFARWILSEKERGAPLQDFALLLRKIRGNERWLKALTAAGIPIAVGSGGLFWEDPRTRELVAFLKWWENPANTLSGAVFLRAPWVGIADTELDRWRREDPTWAKPFFASSHPVANALAPLRGKVLRPGELLMALVGNDLSGQSKKTEEIEKELGTNLLGLWHRAEELSSRGLDFHAVVGELALSTEEHRRERDVPPPRNQGQLQVLTLHGAKGLEFQHVILLDFGKKNRAPNSPTLFWDPAKGAYLVRKDSEGERIEDEAFLQWKKEEREKELAESKRVFYVALTRARERLVLVCPEIPEIESPEIKEDVYGQDFWRGWLEASGALREIPEARLPERELAPDVRSEIVARAPSARARVAVFAPKYRRPRHSVTEWNLLSRCPRAYEWTFIRPRAGQAEKIQFEDWDLAPTSSGEGELTQRELGTEVHACLETGDLDRLSELERRAGSGRFQARAVREWAERSPTMNRELGGFTGAFTELAFEIPVAGEVLVGSMDRVIETAQGYEIIDFKVTRHAKTAEALLETYATQMKLYQWALACLTDPIDPTAKTRPIRARLVSFSESSAQELEVPGPQENPAALVEALARQASGIIAGEPGEPRPGAQCEVCQFRFECLPEI